MSTPVQTDASFEALLDFIRDERGFDFRGYKRPSLTRRIQKRMQALRIAGYDEYQRYLEAHEDEFVDLFNTILINVTSFFRDRSAWDYLAEEIVPSILEAKDDGSIRVWSTGCASGEEAYTLAMIFAEAMGEDGLRSRVKIYATDVDEEALTEGRHASYPLKQLESVPEELAKRYFDRIDERFVFRPELRRSVIFGRHDLVQDPPIPRIDLVCSRNTLMYFNPDAQARILANYHFALVETGYLFLGKSEVLLARSALFTPVDLERRIFRKVVGRVAREAALGARPEDIDFAALATEAAVRDAGFEAAPVAQLIVDGAGVVAMANHQARTLFNLARRDVGQPVRDLELSYKPLELRPRIEEAYAVRHAVVVRDVDWTRESGEMRSFDVYVVPLVAGRGGSVGVAITFADVTRYRQLQEQLEEAQRHAEAASEELQSTVAELETTNAELQSTNEELETTNAELQSTNEELETMNDELTRRTDELNVSNAFLESILTSLDAGVVVVDRQLRITAWNRGAEDLWGLRQDEVEGQHLMNLDIGLPVDQLRRPLKTALSDGSMPIELVVAATNRRGQAIDCKIVCSPLNGSSGVQGAILLMERAGGS